MILIVHIISAIILLLMLVGASLLLFGMKAATNDTKNYRLGLVLVTGIQLVTGLLLVIKSEGSIAGPCIYAVAIIVVVGAVWIGLYRKNTVRHILPIE